MDTRNCYDTDSAAVTEEGTVEIQLTALKNAYKNRIVNLNNAYLIDSSKLSLFNKIGSTERCEVFLSKWHDQDVVIKKIKIKRELENIHKKMYSNEVKIMYSLTEANVPNVIKFFGYDIQDVSHEDAFLPYHFNIIMEHAACGTLHDLIKRTRFNTPLSWKMRYEILVGVACGLKHIHLHGIIHRDIKNANIFLDQDMQAKIADFGISIYKNDESKLSIGTTIYMAPESLVSNIYSEKTDIFSFAISAYEVAAYIMIGDVLPKEIRVLSNTGKIDVEKTRINQHAFLVSEKRPSLPNECPSSLLKLITWGWKTSSHERPTASEAEQMLEEGLKSLELK